MSVPDFAEEANFSSILIFYHITAAILHDI